MEGFVKYASSRYKKTQCDKMLSLKASHLKNNPPGSLSESLLLQLLDFKIDSVFK